MSKDSIEELHCPSLSTAWGGVSHARYTTVCFQTSKPTTRTRVVHVVSLFKKQNTTNCHKDKKSEQITIIKLRKYSFCNFSSTHCTAWEEKQ